MNNENTQDLGKLLKGQRFAMLTTAEAGGALVSAPMTIQEVEEPVVRFIMPDDDIAQQADGKQVNLAVVDGNDYVSLSGTGRIERNVAKKQELWGRLTEAYGGDPEDPSNVILEVTVASGKYWDSGNPIATAFGLAKAAVTGDRPESGETGHVRP